MSNLLTSLLSSAGALNAYDQVLEVTQNNVSNASTPGYVKQRQSLLALPFDPGNGLVGGVRAGDVESARDEYAEQAVRRQTVSLGEAQQNVTSFTALQSAFDITGNSGIPNALNNLFATFSAWAQSPTDTNSRQNVIERATDVAHAFQQTAGTLDNLSQDAERQASQTVDQVNTLAAQLQTYNVRVMQGSRNDAGLDSAIHATLEDLSQYVDITALKQDDGTYSVLLNGQTPLLLEDRQYKLQYRDIQPADPPPTYPNSLPAGQVLAADGTDVTKGITTGKLGALLNMRNTVLPQYLGNAYQAGDLNQTAKQFADRVNQILTSGNQTDDSGNTLTGVPLFTYDATNDTNVARSMAVVDGITPDQLAPADPGPPPVSNGIPLALSNLASPQAAADQIRGESFSQFYGGMASRAGSALNDANALAQGQESAVEQAKNLRQQISGVSLDEEATTLIQFQRSYEANSRLITVLNQLTEDLINILQP